MGVSSQETRLGEKSTVTLAYSNNKKMLSVPCDLLVFTLTRLHLQTQFVHLVYIACRLHVRQDIVLQFRDRLQWKWHILVLLDIANHLGGLCAFGKVDKVRFFDEGGDTVFDEGQVGKIYTCFR
jgi:hypothetical protein